MLMVCVCVCALYQKGVSPSCLSVFKEIAIDEHTVLMQTIILSIYSLRIAHKPNTSHYAGLLVYEDFVKPVQERDMGT